MAGAAEFLGWMDRMVSMECFDSVSLKVMLAFSFIPKTSGFSKSGKLLITAL